MKKTHRPGSRSRARERALQALYQVDLAGAAPMDALATALGNNEDEQAPDAEAAHFAEQLVRGVDEHGAEIDAAIEKHSHHWRIDRMSKVDRNILRLAVYELLHERATPPRVVLNEAIELAKRFGTEESSAFVNGILDKIAQSLPPAAP